MVEPNVFTSAGNHRFGFGGMEKDDDWKGDGNSLDFGARIYDPRVGRWLSIDSKAGKYTAYTPFNYALNSPIVFIDPDGNIVTLYDKKGNKVATITEAGTVIEKGMENSSILKSYEATKAYFKGTSGYTDLISIENNAKNLIIKENESEKIDGLATFRDSGKKYIKRDDDDKNGNNIIEISEIQTVEYSSLTELGTIEWNPMLGVIDSDGNRHSPAMVFIHEIKHAKHFMNNVVQFYKDEVTIKKGVGNIEEEKTMNETNEVSKEKGNGDGGNGKDKKRTKAGGSSFNAKSTTSNKAREKTKETPKETNGK